MRRLVLLEEVPADFKTAPEDQVVALTPQASYRLGKLRQPYRIASDFGVETALLKMEEAYWEEQLNWFDQLDRELQERIPEFESRCIRPAILYGYQLKLWLDNLFIRGFEAVTLLQDGYDRVVLYPGRAGAAPTDFLRFSQEQEGVYARVFRWICHSRRIPYQAVNFSAPPIDGEGSVGGRFAGWKLAVKQWLESVQALTLGMRLPSRRLTLLLLDARPYLDELLQKAQKSGHRCLVQQDDRILDFSVGGRVIQHLRGQEGRLPETMAARWDATAEDLLSPAGPLWKWPNSWFGCPPSPLLEDFLKGWMTRELPELIPFSDAFHDFYMRQGVDFVIAPFLTRRFHFPAIAACYRPRSAQSVLVSDGARPDTAKAWDLTELFRTQHYFIQTSEFADYFQRRRSLYAGRPTASVHVGSHQWPSYRGLARRPRVYLRRGEGGFSLRVNRPPLAVHPGRPIVVYAVSMPDVDVRFLNRPDYSETWYYRVQAELVRAFAALAEYTVVIKPFPSSEVRHTAIECLVGDLGASHLVISRAPFRDWLPWADRVILDTPSTTLYETALAGVPFHLLVHRRIVMRPAGLLPFKSCVTFFDHPQEAAVAVTNYLRSPHTGRPDLKLEGPDILDTLVTLLKRNPTPALPTPTDVQISTPEVETDFWKTKTTVLS